MSLESGARLGPYEIVAAIGAGGMGEVYRARDTRLKRDVALKILPDSFASDPERLARFQREAEVLAALNHPHIAAIYGLEETDGTRALVMELVEGETLADRIAAGPIPLDEALPIARQIAEALEAAHEQGIIHRDLKPANIKLTPNGVVKVLDFGLAKLADSAVATTSNPSALSMSPTITSPELVSGVGVLLGTAAYMSPEQARGGSVDRRADLWAFGVVLYEMLTGMRLFDGPTVPDTLAQVLMKEPSWTALSANTPAPIRRLLRRTLEKDRRKRFESAADARLEIEEALAAPTAEQAPARPPKPVVLVAVAALMAGAIAATLTTWTLMRRAPGAPGLAAQFEIPLPAARSLWQGAEARGSIAVSPDGSRVALVGTAGPTGERQLIVRRLDDLKGSLVPGTNGATSPFFSPDGRWVAFFAGNEIKKVPLAGGPPVSVCRIVPIGENQDASGAWLADDTIIFSRDADDSEGLQAVAAGGGEPKVVAKPSAADSERGFGSPAALPGSHAVLLSVKTFNGPRRVAVLDLDSARRTTLVRNGSGAQYVEGGYLVYLVDGTLQAVRFDAARRTILGDPTAFFSGVSISGFGIAPNGTLVYAPTAERPRRDIKSGSLVWVDRHGQETATGAPSRRYGAVDLSPDGTRAAVDIRDPTGAIWIWDFARRALTRLAAGPENAINPIWTLDGKGIVYSGSRAGSPGVFLEAADGSGTIEQLLPAAALQIPKGVTPDGKSVLTTNGNNELGLVALQRPFRARVLLTSAAGQNDPDASPDGRWIAYQSDESGMNEVYVRPFPNVQEGRWQVSTIGGRLPVWGRNGQELFFLDGDGFLTAAVVSPGATFNAGPPTRVLETRYTAPGGSRAYDVSPDGQRFLMLKADESEDAPDAPGNPVVVLNWLDELKRIVPMQ